MVRIFLRDRNDRFTSPPAGRNAQIPVIRRGLAEPVNSTRTGLSPGMAVWCWLPLVGVIARLKDKGRPEGGLLPCSSD
jgi:hypothetical protein